MQIAGPSRQHLEDVGNQFAELIAAGVRQAVNVAAKDLKATSTPDDLGVIRRVFTKYAESTLMPYLQKQWDISAEQQRQRILDAALTAAGLPPLAKNLSETYMATASNRLVGVSDEIWEHARGQLVEGLQSGESIPQLRKRVQAATGLSRPRAEQIARTEVIGAQNRGSLEQMKAAGYPATKQWLAIIDHRTRQSHAAANHQEVQLEEKFSVGGVAMDGPHDPFAPPGETISCRCTLTYEIADDDLPDPSGYRQAALSSLDDWNLPDLPEPDDDMISTGVGDRTLAAIWKKQGFDGKPSLVSSAQLDEEIAGGAKEIFRGLSGSEAETYAAQFKTGEAFPGLGNYGNGHYFAPSRKVGEQYASSGNKPGALIRSALRADAKVITYDDLQKEMRTLFSLGPDAIKVFDPGRLASALGFDAIYVPSTDFYVVLNRTALLVED